MSSPLTDTPDPIITADNLRKVFKPRGGAFGGKGRPVVAVDDVSFSLDKGRTLGIVGESGCGKTTLGRMLTALERPTSGRVVFEGEDLFSLPSKNLSSRRAKLQIVFQDPMGSLNPRMRVGKAAIEPMVIHGMAKGDWKDQADELFARVGLDESLVTRYPHELSGGQRQRVCIARAVATNPSLIIADEPVASLDISVQTQILTLFNDLYKASGMALIMISHDIRVIRAVCRDVMVLYLGRIVERGPSAEVLTRPMHPYTKLLIDSVPSLDPEQKSEAPESVERDDIPEQGCPFYPRCDHAQGKCKHESPKEMEFSDNRYGRCLYPITINTIV